MKDLIGIIGAGAMGTGIIQVAAQNGHRVLVYEQNRDVQDKSKENLSKTLARLLEKGKITEEEKISVLASIQYVNDFHEMSECKLIIEAVVENLDVKKTIFSTLDSIVSDQCILASNTSSLSIASIGSACKNDGRVIGIHFFNPAPLMPLVEIIPSVATTSATIGQARNTINSWKKITVLAKDTPGFIVNRIARPFYGEAIRLFEEGIADIATIDQAMKDRGFKMGPFELMDYIGNDINYTVTETIFRDFFYDPRYKPSFTQKRMMESGRLGRKTGRGYYDYAEGSVIAKPAENSALKEEIFYRIITMLINEAIDALYLNIASKEDIETSMINGVNYPKGLLKWADEISLKKVLGNLEKLQADYSEDRYRASYLLKKMVSANATFY